jgi:hypothetical protein
LITVAAAVVVARILAVGASLGDNDRSRWATVRALVDHGTYVIGHRDRNPRTGQYCDRGIITEKGWETVDKVLRPDTQDFYSSKPPLLPTVVAGEYWLLKKVLGWSLTEHQACVVRVILLTFNAVPLVLYLALLGRLVDRFGLTEWGRLYTLVAGAFGTFVTTFANTLNNHTVAAYMVLFAMYAALRLLTDPARSDMPTAPRSRAGSLGEAGLFFAAGFCAGLALCGELQAAAFAAALMLLLLMHMPRRTLLVFVPAAAIPVAALLLTNYWAIGQLRPAYSEYGGPWYEYDGSYWKSGPGQPMHGIDSAGQQESKAVYAFHLLLGHHGLFSLSPIYFLALPAMVSRRRDGAGSFGLGSRAGPEVIPQFTLAITVVVVAFHVVETDNYGGWTSGPRWFFWLTPLLLLTLLPVADRLGSRRWGRVLAYLLLAGSVVSASYALANPWKHPWLFDFLQSRGWIRY